MLPNWMSVSSISARRPASAWNATIASWPGSTVRMVTGSPPSFAVTSTAVTAADAAVVPSPMRTSAAATDTASLE